MLPLCAIHANLSNWLDFMIVPLFHVTKITRVCDRSWFWIKLHHPFHVLFVRLTYLYNLTRLREGKKNILWHVQYISMPMHCLWRLLLDIEPMWSILDDPDFLSLVTCQNREMNQTSSSVSKYDNSRFLLGCNSHHPVFQGLKGTWGCRPHFLRIKLWPRSPAQPPSRMLWASGQTGHRHRWGCQSP